MTENKYQVRQVKADFHFVETILYKYHKISETLANLPSKNKYPTFIEELGKLAQNGVVKLDTLSDISINQFGKIGKDQDLQILDIIDLKSMNDTEVVAFNTLAVIVYQYCIHDYTYYFARHRGSNMSDKDASDYDEHFIKDAYDTLKDLKNLLLFRDEGFKDNVITIDKTVQRDIGQGKMKDYIVKENQIAFNDISIISKVCDLLIKEKLSEVETTQNQYLNSLKFQNKQFEKFTYELANKEFEKIRSSVEKDIKGKKQSSKKSVFKGLVSKLVKKFVKDEDFTMNEKIVDERQAQLLAYTLLSWFGLISLDLINSHKNRDARIKYMDSLPKWEDEVILPNRMNFTTKDELFKNYSPS